MTKRELITIAAVLSAVYGTAVGKEVAQMRAAYMVASNDMKA